MRNSACFADRADAGKALATRLATRGLEDPVVLALPRGGVPVAVEIARALHAPIDVVLVRKIGVPEASELAVAAVVDGGEPEVVINGEVMKREAVPQDYIAKRTKIELAEIERRRRVYLAGRQRISLEGRTLVLVDDGIATGASVRAAIAALRCKRPKRLILAVPVASGEAIALLRGMVDEVVCLEMPEPFQAVGESYRDFHQLSDREVVNLMRAADTAYEEAETAK